MGVQDPEIFFNLGYVYTLDGQYAYAEQMYSQVLPFKPSYLDEAYFNLGYVQNKQGKLDESMANLNQALQINPDNRSARKLLQNISSNR